MIYQNIVLLSAFLVLYSIFAGRQESHWVNGALMFMLVGILLGPFAFDVLHLSITNNGIRLIAELTLAIVLFTDAAHANLKVLRTYNWMPLRLLLLGLPICLLAGWVLGLLIFPNMPWIEVAVLATILAPTDAALGKAVVTNADVPAPIREGLNMESGLNDGICVPVLFILLAIMTSDGINQGTLTNAILVILEEIGIGLFVGVSLAYLSVSLMKLSIKHQWNSPLWDHLTLTGLALLAFSLAQLLGGSGFIASFICGLCVGQIINKNINKYLINNEGVADLLSILVWIIFGASVLANTWAHFTWQTWLYAILSLTVIRGVAVLISLLGTSLSTESRLFIAWFGPRGLASIVFTVIIFQHELIAKDTLIATAVCTVFLSVILHGITANPWIARYRVVKKATHK